MRSTVLATAFPLGIALALGLGSATPSPASELCIVPSAVNGINGSLDCGPVPELHPNGSIGYSTTTGPCAAGELNFCLKVENYTWTISSSETDPYENEGPVPQLATLYLWYNCPPYFASGLSAAEFDLHSSFLVVLALTVQNGFLNAGTAQSPLLAVGGCPIGPVVAASLLVLDVMPVAASASIETNSWGAIKALYRD